ncbi:unnamed protein product [Sphagnum jensenii]|uniref:Uncharacterized protein n=1 Tax=Sphagnum jensenii TaxID=128206 RepID=A0ABP0VSM8_9BRYO
MEMQLRKPSYERQLLPCLPVEASHVDKKTLLCKICEAEEEAIAQMNQEHFAAIEESVEICCLCNPRFSSLPTTKSHHKSCTRRDRPAAKPAGCSLAANSVLDKGLVPPGPVAGTSHAFATEYQHAECIYRSSTGCRSPTRGSPRATPERRSHGSRSPTRASPQATPERRSHGSRSPTRESPQPTPQRTSPGRRSSEGMPMSFVCGCHSSGEGRGISWKTCGCVMFLSSTLPRILSKLWK